MPIKLSWNISMAPESPWMSLDHLISTTTCLLQIQTMLEDSYSYFHFVDLDATAPTGSVTLKLGVESVMGPVKDMGKWWLAQSPSHLVD